MVRVEVVSKDVGVGKNGAKARIAQEYSLARPRAKLQIGICELEDHVGKKG